ncbi:MAG TPA: bifunctional hydroxymethylpyrimidine kinase/phosphomethylpyrimidine kinase [Epsilonproteobacteria bacterium]|nr:bifunctional hydroxymethylpyrimidine kinase/phosphomethylpyrimidine kinase [Campylobacterota bacterium]
MSTKYTPTVLTIAGSDSYGGAGIQVDTKVIHALDGYAFSVITALTAQNSTGVKEVFPTPAKHFKMQLEALLKDIKIDAVKIGMLANAEMISIVVEAIDYYKLKNVVLDTVLVSSSGKRLLEPSAITVMVEELFPRVDLITPNIPEVNTLLDTQYSGNSDEIMEMAQGLFDLGAKAVLIKGGHSQDNENATDYLVEDRCEPTVFTTTRLHTTHTHGTGCVLSSAIATSLAKNERLEKSVQIAKDFLYQKLHTSSRIVFEYCSKGNTRKEPLI